MLAAGLLGAAGLVLGSQVQAQSMLGMPPMASPGGPPVQHHTGALRMAHNAVIASKDDAPAADRAATTNLAGVMPTAGGSTPAEWMTLTGQLVGGTSAAWRTIAGHSTSPAGFQACLPAIASRKPAARALPL